MTDTEQQITPVVMDVDNSPQSPMEALRAKRDEIASRTTVLIPLPEYEEMGLHVKYRLVGRDETGALGKRVSKRTKDQSEQLYQVLVGTMIHACEGFYLKPEGVSDEDAELLPAEKPGDPSPSTFQELAYALSGGQEFSSAINAVAYVFGDNEFAVGTHAMLLNRWLGNTELDVEAELAQG